MEIYHTVGINKIFALHGRLGQIQEVRGKMWGISEVRVHSLYTNGQVGAT